jgi:hypothetical protein
MGKKKLKWQYRATRKLYSAESDGVVFVIWVMTADDGRYRLSVYTEEDWLRDEYSYADYIWDFKYLKSAKAVAELILNG